MLSHKPKAWSLFTDGQKFCLGLRGLAEMLVPSLACHTKPEAWNYRLPLKKSPEVNYPSWDRRDQSWPWGRCRAGRQTRRRRWRPSWSERRRPWETSGGLSDERSRSPWPGPSWGQRPRPSCHPDTFCWNLRWRAREGKFWPQSSETVTSL